MKAFQIKMINEKFDLQGKIYTLESYLGTEQAKVLDPEIKSLMVKQLKCMKGYNRFLGDRLKRMEIKF